MLQSDLLAFHCLPALGISVRRGDKSAGGARLDPLRAAPPRPCESALAQVGQHHSNTMSEPNGRKCIAAGQCIAPLDTPATAGAVLRFYRFPGLASSACDTLLRRLAATVKPVSPVALDTEFCYYVELGWRKRYPVLDAGTCL